MTAWISLDWDFVTGDCHQPMVEHCECWDSPGQLTAGTTPPPYLGEPEVGRGSSPMPPAPFCAWWARNLDSHNGLLAFLTSASILPPVRCENCHAGIYRFLSPGDVIWNLDAHDDTSEGDGMDDGRVRCYSWVSAARRLGATVHQVPTIADVRQIPQTPFRLFIAHSLPYTSSRWDGMLMRLLSHLRIPVLMNHSIDVIMERPAGDNDIPAHRWARDPNWPIDYTEPPYATCAGQDEGDEWLPPADPTQSSIRRYVRTHNRATTLEV